MLYLIANWKSQDPVVSLAEWVMAVEKIAAEKKDAIVVVCPTFTSLEAVKELTKTTHIQVGAQDISPFDAGSYTGEVNGKQIAHFATYVIIGHSERRTHFGETDAILSQKVQQAKAAGLKIVFCVQDESTPVPEDVDIIAYEPVFAIGTGTTDTPEHAQEVASILTEKTGVSSILYGGSVTGENVAAFLAQKNIAGVLVGRASVNPEQFTAVINHA